MVKVFVILWFIQWSIGYYDIASFLLNSGAKAEVDYYGSSILVPLINDGQYDLCKKFIEKGADVNFADKYGMTPLVSTLSAVYCDYDSSEDNKENSIDDIYRIVDLLMDNGAVLPPGYINKVMSNGLIYAEHSDNSSDNLNVWKYIINKYKEKKLDIEIDDLLYEIINGNNEKVLNQLNSKYMKNINENTLSIFSAAFCDISVLKKEIEFGIDFNNIQLYYGTRKSDITDIASIYNSAEVYGYLSDLM